MKDWGRGILLGFGLGVLFGSSIMVLDYNHRCECYPRGLVPPAELRP